MLKDRVVKKTIRLKLKDYEQKIIFQICPRQQSRKNPTKIPTIESNPSFRVWRGKVSLPPSAQAWLDLVAKHRSRLSAQVYKYGV